MRVFDIIQKKRDKVPLSNEEILYLIKGYTSNDIPDYQMSAFAMAVFLNGMTGQELAAFTDAMLHSGSTVDFSHLDRPVIDKHSTGGVGDKISIPLAPAVAACGVAVPMISGRGLGHSGGTLDKLESIPGFKTDFDELAFKKMVAEIGCCLIGQTKEIAPADKKLYALRDVTATVECIPLIASSIMSKKLAEGIDGLVLDVKFGSGAFIQELAESIKLARAMVEIATRMGKTCVARLTNMDQPLGRMIGNSLEIRESIDVLKGIGPDDVTELVVELGAEMLLLGKVVGGIEQGRQNIRTALSNGRALDKFVEIIRAQNGDPNIIDNYDLLPTTNRIEPFVAKTSGVLARINTKEMGFAALELGAGRNQVKDSIDPRVGIEMLVRIGDQIQKGQPICELHVGEKGIPQATARLENAFVLQSEKIASPELFGPRITSENL